MKQRVFGSYLTATALVAASLVSSGRAYAQDEAEPEEPAAEEPEAAPSEPSEAPAPDAEAQAASQAQADADVGVKLDTSADVDVDVAPTEEAPKAGKAKSTRYGNPDEWKVEPYGYVRFDTIRDSTQSFFDGQQPYLIARAGTYKGMHPRWTMTARDTRIGLSLGAPKYAGISTSGKIEFDFFGIPPTDVRENDQLSFGPVRIRHGYVRLDNSIVDVLAGQYYDLFGWGPTFYPATVAFLGVPGQVYHRNPQLRLEKVMNFGGFGITAALAAVRPGQRDSGVPDGQAGVKFSIDQWSGAAAQGFGQAGIVPVSLGLSAIYRHFEMPAFRNEPGAESVSETGYGAAANAVIPVIPAKQADDKGNALTLTGEFSLGTGISDMYTGMDGGSRLPLLPNTRPGAGAGVPAYVYPQNVDPGLVTFDRNWDLATIDWQAFVVGLQYYLPIGGGDVWVSGVYSQIKSDNIKELTPSASWGAVFTKMEYIDASVGVAVTPAVSLGLSFQTLKQTFADVSPPTPVWGATADYVNGQTLPTTPGTGGEAASARNNRAQLTLAFFF
ncbi:MAG TPA: hypothetical protein VHO25_01020 [Polyangiaceae bacterium]|nr:hypothetical protein [Polyangiaceae bacterium]